MKSSFLSRVLSLYKFLAILITTTFILLVLVNLVLSFQEEEAITPPHSPFTNKYEEELVLKAYPSLSRSEISTLLRETWSRPLVYEPFTQFKESLFEGTYINVHSAGFRSSTPQGPWPPDKKYFNIFMFGGSTLFGYGLPDNETIANHLQKNLNSKRRGKKVRIYNFGRAHYYSTQERILFQQLITSGTIPNLAIFLDGLNEYQQVDDKPHYTKSLSDFVENGQSQEFRKNYELQKTDYLFIWLNSLPLTKMALKYHNQLMEDPHSQETLTPIDDKPDDLLAMRIEQRYWKNKKLIEALASRFKIATLFVWQPVPMYHYDLKYHLFADKTFEHHELTKVGYQRMAKQIKKRSTPDNFIWLANEQKGLNRNLYIDQLHYNQEMSERIAAKIKLAIPVGLIR
jgi:hypothetical protein